MSRANRSFVFISWAIIVSAGVFALAKYDATPGAAAMARANEAVPPVIGSVSDEMTLVMFIHPRCPCSAASVEELSKLMGRCGGRLRAFVMMFQPSGRSENWSRTETWFAASRIPGVAVRGDVDAILARKCGAQTSGQVFLYGRNGSLLFEGGITGSRGHVGDNDGLSQVIKLVLGEIPPDAPRVHVPVFGCAICPGADDGSASPSTEVRQ